MKEKNKAASRMFEKHTVLRKLREYFFQEGFTEVSTTIFREEDHDVYPRIQVDDGTYLRRGIEEPLKLLLEFHDKVFEIGTCFRSDMDFNPKKHLYEFSMLELFIANERLDYAIETLRNMLKSIDPSLDFEIYSVAECIKEDTGIDLYNSYDHQHLLEILEKRFSNLRYSHPPKLLWEYIEQSFHPLADNKNILFIDYPLYVNPVATIKSGCVVDHFELVLNGIEVAGGAQDEGDGDAFYSRSIKYECFNKEERIISEALKARSIPTVSVGLAVGIERLCMAIFNSDDIREFVFPKIKF